MASEVKPELADQNEDTILSVTLRQALADLEHRVRSGQTRSCESTLAEFPQLAESKDARLELIYTEYVLRQERNEEPPPEELSARFPQWQEEIRQLFEVHSYIEDSAGPPLAAAPPLDSWWFDGDRRAPQTGERLGAYELLAELGSGGTGTVYRARQSPLQREVALKTLHGSHPEALSRFRLEAEAAARLQHPNIVQIFEVGAAGERPYFTMEYVAGGNLAAVIRQRPLAALAAARLLAPLARAVHYAHERGVVHRDIKPANLLLASGERPEAVQLPDYSVGHELAGQRFELKITDFGLAKCAELQPGETQPGATLGTPSYMAPEHAERGATAAGPACDIYALGAVLYDMLVGRPPFHAATVAETLQRLQRDEPVSIRRLQPAVPRDLETICHKCLHRDPSRRYASAAELAEDSERFLKGQPVRARPLGIAERGLKWTRRHPAMAALAASLALGAIGIGWEWRRAEVHRAQAVQQANVATQARLAEETEHERALRTLYAHDVSLANFEFHSNNTARATQLLAACPSHLRHWEWKYLERVVQQQLGDFQGFDQPLRSVAVSRDGRLVAAASATWGVNRRGEVRVWEVASGKLLHTLTAHPSSVMDVEFDPSGRRLVTAGVIWQRNEGGGVHVWDLSTGEPVWSLPEARSHAAAFSPDGRTLAIGHASGKITLHDSDTGRELKSTSGQRGVIFDLAFRPDGAWLASASRDGTFQVWELAGNDPVLASGFVDVRRVAYSPDGGRLAVGLFSGSIRQYEQQGQQLTEVTNFHLAQRLGGLKYSPDGQYLVVTSLDQSIQFLDAKTAQRHRELFGHNGTAMDVGLSEDGRIVATCGLDGSVKVWDLARQAGSRRRIIPGPFLADLAFLPGGKLAAVATAYNTTGIRNHERPTLKLWDVERGEFTKALPGHSGWLTSVAAEANGRWILSGSEDQSAILWDARQFTRLHTLTGHTTAIKAVAFLDVVAVTAADL